MKRRNFLKFSVLATGLGVVGAGASPAAAGAPPLPSVEAMRRIGRLHLDARPDELPDARALRARIDAAGGLDRGVLRRVMADDLRRDLDRAEVVTVDGWVLPRALVRVCCAVALG
jgi:hypothetical protein